MDSKKIARAFNMPVLNYGVNAGIELPYTLHIVKKVIHPGDIILMPLEYPMYSYDGTPGAQMIDNIFSRGRGFFWKISLKEQIYMLLHVDFKRVLQRFLCPGGEPVTVGLYGAHNIDDNGDQINTGIKFQTPAMVKEIKRHDLNPENYSKTFDAGAMGWQYIRDFMEYCKKNQVTVTFMPSTLMKHESFFTNPKEKWFYENIAGRSEKEDGPISATPMIICMTPPCILIQIFI